MLLKPIATTAGTECVIYYPHIVEYGGIERNIVALSQSILNRGFQPVLLCHYDMAGMTEFAKDLRVEVLGGLTSSRLSRLQALRARLRRLDAAARGLPLFFADRAGHYGVLANVSGAVLHYTDPPSLLSTAGTVSAGMWRKAATRARAAVAHAVLQRAVRSASIRITMTRANAEELQGLYGCPFEVIYQGGVPPAPGFTRRLPAAYNDRTLVFFSVCRLNASKNLDWIIDAALAVRRSVPRFQDMQVQVVLAGQGNDKERISAYARLANMIENLQFPGFLTPAELEEHYARADLVLVPGRQGYGLPVLEALYRGVPVVVSRESRVSEILAGRSNVAISEHDRKSFSEAAVHLVRRIVDDKFLALETPPLPTEAEWGDNIGRRCGWW